VNCSVVIPAYRAAAELNQCLAALARTLPQGVRVLVADDASPSPEVGEVVRQWQGGGRLQLDYVRREKNLGFVGNVNRAFQETAPDDVMLLNSDAVPAQGWWQRMLACAASDPRIATITPWSNNAEICSFPRLCDAAPVPSTAEADAIAQAARAAGKPEYPELPTGVGFCMFVRRAALEAIGDFDEATFGKGYGEENDFCQRAIGHGWKNVLCDDAYVAHLGGASFSATGHAPGGENLRRLLARYPGYNTQVADFILRDPLARLRQRIQDGLQSSAIAAAQTELFPPTA